MVEKAAMLVIRDEQKAFVPLGARAQGLVHLLQESAKQGSEMEAL